MIKLSSIQNDFVWFKIFSALLSLGLVVIIDKGPSC